jgi:hypothetical protein
MGVRIIGDWQLSTMYCSTTEWAFGPVFSDDNDHDADERIHSFLRFLGTIDPRTLTDRELSRKHTEWRAQEDAQWQAEKLAQELKDLQDD